MRPVLLEMDGFASFRQRTTVNFDDVDYFALVGATGAGKSTVIDAITFALYGSAARWDDQGAVAPALAPTINRGTVRLVFDVRGARYQVLRELRRDGNGKVATKTARLERLLEPDALGDIDDPIELIAGSLRETLVAVEQLLGLDFNQFIKCVALPQGDFAEFLHAKPSDRDKILTRLLGLEGYLALGKTATARASRLTTRADTLQDQLDNDQTDASDDALTAATARHQALDSLQGKVHADLDELQQLTEQERAATLAVSDLERTVTLLNEVSLPEHIRPLDDDLAAAKTAHATATAALVASEHADELARAALRDHEPRSRLEAWQQQHVRRQQLLAAAPELRARVAQTQTDRNAAETSVTPHGLPATQPSRPNAMPRPSPTQQTPPPPPDRPTSARCSTSCDRPPSTSSARRSTQRRRTATPASRRSDRRGSASSRRQRSAAPCPASSQLSGRAPRSRLSQPPAAACPRRSAPSPARTPEPVPTRTPPPPPRGCWPPRSRPRAPATPGTSPRSCVPTCTQATPARSATSRSTRPPRPSATTTRPLPRRT